MRFGEWLEQSRFDDLGELFRSEEFEEVQGAWNSKNLRRGEWSDGSPRAVMGPGQPTEQRLAAIEERLREAESLAQRAAAEVEDGDTSVTLQHRVKILEERLEDAPDRGGDSR